MFVFFVIFARMKAKLFVIGWFMLVLSACTSTKVPEPVEGPSPELCAIDSLMWRQPDSALAYLLPYFDTCVDAKFCVSTATAYNRHYANLLLAELLYKNDYPQTNRTELLQAVAYFDSLVGTPGADTRGVSLQGRPRRDARRASAKNATQTNVFLAARAHYINGVGYYENDSAVQACKEYLKALERIEEHFDEKELIGKKAKFMALTFSHLTSLFSDLYLHEQAIYFGKKSLHYFNKHDASPQHVAWALDEIGLHYDILHNYDSADYYYRKGVKTLPDTNSSTYRDIATHLAFISYKKGDLVTPLNQLHTIKAQAESDYEYAARCLTIGEIYYHERQYDSAWQYLNTVFNKSKNTGSKKQAAEWLAEIAETQGNNAEALKFASFLVPYANLEENQSGIKSQLIALYDESKQAHVDYQRHKETLKHLKLGIIVLGILLLALFFLFYKSIRHKKTLEAERHAHKMQQAALVGRLKRSNAALKEREKTASSINSLSFTQQPNRVESYVEEPICQQILAVCNDKNNSFKSNVPVSAYSNIALTDAQKAQLKNAALRHYSSLFEKLRLQHPEMKEKDFLYCYLCLLGLDNIQIAVLLQNSISTIWEREKRLKTFFGSENRIAIILHEYMIN